MVENIKHTDTCSTSLEQARGIQLFTHLIDKDLNIHNV